MVGLIGPGQEIHTGEEAGIAGWFEAINSEHAISEWKVYAPPRFSKEFSSNNVTECEELDLNHSLRSKQAEFLHQWVQCLLEGDLAGASKVSQKIWLQNFPIFVTRNLDEAKDYVSRRFH